MCLFPERMIVSTVSIVVTVRHRAHDHPDDDHHQPHQHQHGTSESEIFYNQYDAKYFQVAGKDD